MDGVFCDFEKGVQQITGGATSEEVEDDKLWPLIMNSDSMFFANLDPMVGAIELWKEVGEFLERSHQKIPIFLTGCPSNPQFRIWAEKGKEAWVRKHMLENGGEIHILSVPPTATVEDARDLEKSLENMLEHAGPDDCIMIFCRPKQKYFFSRNPDYTAVLLDDRASAGKLWVSPGFFLWHESTPLNFKNKSHRNTTSKRAVNKSVKKLKNLKGGKRRTNSRRTH